MDEHVTWRHWWKFLDRKEEIAFLGGVLVGVVGSALFLSDQVADFLAASGSLLAGLMTAFSIFVLILIDRRSIERNARATALSSIPLVELELHDKIVAGLSQLNWLLSHIARELERERNPEADLQMQWHWDECLKVLATTPELDDVAQKLILAVPTSLDSISALRRRRRESENFWRSKGVNSQVHFGIIESNVIWTCELVIDMHAVWKVIHEYNPVPSSKIEPNNPEVQGHLFLMQREKARVESLRRANYE